MSENGEQQRNKPLQGGSQYKMLSIWLLVFFVIFSLLWFANKDIQQQTEEWTIRDVVQEAQRGAESRLEGTATLKSSPQGGPKWHEVTGKFRQSTNEVVAFRAKGQLTESNLEVLQDSGFFREEPASTIWRDLMVTLLPIMLIIGLLYFLFVRQIRNAGKGAMNFGKSKARMLTRDRERVSFKDVAGCDEAKEEIAEVVEFLKDPKKFQNVGGRIPKGCLLVGPPGTGKTLIARAVAGEADVPFFSISGSDFVEMFVGVGAARVRDMFEQGRKNAPCIIFVDEIDAVGRQRGAGLGGGNDEREQTLNSLLVEMDGFDGHEGVIIMAATNRPDVLDSALLRPGRFDRQVVIDLPDLAGREQILKVHAKKIKISKETELHDIARGTPGFSGADLANLLNEGALLAARYGKKEVDRYDIEEARDKISFGRERRRLMDDDDKRMTAFHEAGHALVRAVIGDGKIKLHKVTIIPRGRALGMTMFMPTKDILGQTKNELLDRICIAMGGRLGEEIETGDFSSGASGDIKQATDTARHMVCDWGMSDLGPVAFGEGTDQIFLAKEITRSRNYSESTAQKIDEAIQKIIRAQFDRAKILIEENQEALRKIADALLEHETIEGKHVHEILEHGEIRSPISVPIAGTKNNDKPSPDEDAPGETEPESDSDRGLSSGSAPVPA